MTPYQERVLDLMEYLHAAIGVLTVLTSDPYREEMIAGLMNMINDLEAQHPTVRIP